MMLEYINTQFNDSPSIDQEKRRNEKKREQKQSEIFF